MSERRASLFVPALGRPATPTPEALAFVVRHGELLVEGVERPARVPCFEELGLSGPRCHYLGALEGIDCFAVPLDADSEPAGGFVFTGLRPLAGVVPDELFWVAGRAVQVVEWDDTHRFCGRCGEPTETVAGELAKRCPSCDLVAYPRIAPAVIVRVTRDDEILLARGRRFAAPMYSCLAGFVEPGESLEETVAREVREEVGIEIRDIRYFGSQPWPFPHSLMVGFTAEHAAGELRPDPGELVDASWFRVDGLPLLPMPTSIARRLIDDWLVPRSQARAGRPS